MTTTDDSNGPTNTTYESTSTGHTPSTSGPSESTDGSTSSSGGGSFQLCDDSDVDLRGCYDFSEIADGVLADLSMYGNDAEVGDVGVEVGPFGDAARPSARARISIPDDESLDVVGPASWEAWVNLDSLPETGRVGIIDNDGQYSMIYSSIQGMRCNAGAVSALAPNIPVREWVHVACTYDGSEISIWLNGELEDSTDGGFSIGTINLMPVSLGDTSPFFNETMDGLIGGVRFWSVVRTEAELEDAAAALD